MPDRKLIKAELLEVGDIIHQTPVSGHLGEWYFKVLSKTYSRMVLPSEKTLEEIEMVHEERSGLDSISYDCWNSWLKKRTFKFCLIKHLNREPDWKV